MNSFRYFTLRLVAPLRPGVGGQNLRSELATERLTRQAQRSAQSLQRQASRTAEKLARGAAKEVRRLERSSASGIAAVDGQRRRQSDRVERQLRRAERDLTFLCGQPTDDRRSTDRGPVVGVDNTPAALQVLGLQKMPQDRSDLERVAADTIQEVRDMARSDLSGAVVRMADVRWALTQLDVVPGPGQAAEPPTLGR